MKAQIDIQVVWSEAKGVVQLFIGDFCIGLPPVLCIHLENELAAARRIPERAREMATEVTKISDYADRGHGIAPLSQQCREHEAGGVPERKTSAAREPETHETR